MTPGMFCSLALAAHLAVGGLGLFDCLKKDRHAFRAPDCCASCGSEFEAVHRLIETMRHHPNWRTRDDAAHDLRKFDWRRHPEVIPALAATLLDDCHEEVREEAAETLARLAPCDEEARFALEQAAMTDPDRTTRKLARKALDRLGDDCGADCPICGVAIVAEPLPTAYEAEAMTPLRAPRVYGEVPYDRVAPRLERRIPTLPPGPGDSFGPGGPALPDPNALPEVLPPAFEPGEGSIEVLPPDLPPPAPPAASPFGASRRPEASPRTAAGRTVGSGLLFSIGRPR